nr:hypothetical protein [Tanacetum cinerariifolium]
MSSPDHPTSNIEDAFSFNFPDYTTASLRNISPDPPDNLSKYLFASLAILPFHNVQAYNAANKPPILSPDPITPPVILPPSSNKPPKNEDGAWHAKIRRIDPDGEEFTKPLQSILTTRKLTKRECPREIIDLDHFYDT